MKMRMICCVASAVGLLVACSKAENASSSANATSDTASTTQASSPSTASTGRNANAVRGQLVSVTDSMLTVRSRGGEVQVHIAQPLEIYSRVPAKLSDVKPNSFVGITSTPQADGTLKATEIHIFPEKLRGTNEGSFLMGQRGGGPGGGNTMTNGTVSGSRMTNGTVAESGNRMTNGTVGAQSGNAITVRFQSDSQTIVVPPTVTVTQIALTETKLAPGMNVVIQTTPSPGGARRASTVMLSPQGNRRRP
jgi:hypothetical protein